LTERGNRSLEEAKGDTKTTSTASYDSGVGGFGKQTPPSGQFENFNKQNIFRFVSQIT
jgi:hypothetical protein